MNITNKIKKTLRKKIDANVNRIKLLLLDNSIGAYWFTRVRNFGDLLNPDIFEYLGYHAVNVGINETKCIMVGSVIDFLPSNYNGSIIGAGLMFNQNVVLPAARIFGLRGYLTKRNLNIKTNEITIGDPGLLVSEIYQLPHNKKYTLGIVPHYNDINDNKIKLLLDRNSDNVKIINVMDRPKKVLEKICECEHILSSSLHGLIVADSLNIPNTWIYLSSKVAGDGFKFYDYASSINRQISPKIITGYERIIELVQITQKPNQSVSEVKARLFEELPINIRNTIDT